MQSEHPEEKELHPQAYRVEIRQTSTRKDAKAKPHTVFHISVAVLDSTKNEELASWETVRRFSQFDRVHKLLQQKFPHVRLPSLPPKKWIGNTEMDFIHKRQKELEKYLRALVVLTKVRESAELNAFLSTNEYQQSPGTPERSSSVYSARLSPRFLEEPLNTSWSPSQFHNILLQMSRQIRELDRRCKFAEQKATTALKIANFATEFLSQETKRKLQRKLRDELKILTPSGRRKAELRQNRILSADNAEDGRIANGRARNRSAELLGPYGSFGGFGTGTVSGPSSFRRSGSASASLGGLALNIDSDDDMQPRLGGDSKFKRAHTEYHPESLWGRSESRLSTTLLNGRPKPKGKEGTFERLLRFQSSNGISPTSSAKVSSSISDVFKRGFSKTPPADSILASSSTTPDPLKPTISKPNPNPKSNSANSPTASTNPGIKSENPGIGVRNPGTQWGVIGRGGGGG